MSKRFDATVVFANYGANAAAGGSEGLRAFLEGYRLLLDELEEEGSGSCSCPRFPERIWKPLPRSVRLQREP